MVKTPLIEVKNLVKTFEIKGKPLRAIDNVSLKIFPNETLGLVGESGCGKTTLARVLMHLYKATSGDILFKNASIMNYKPQQIRQMRRQMQYIFQDPYASLNPRMTAREIILEPLHIHRVGSSLDREKWVRELFTLVGLDPEDFSRFPHEFSGGQRQRIGIARALSLRPDFIVCDEPVAALDASIQAQIINLLKKLKKERGLTYLFISHDLALVKYLSNQIAVMYLGKLMEFAPSSKLYENPLHPYTQALLSAIPTIGQKHSRILLKGDIPNPTSPPKGCLFCTRCPKVMPICKKKPPIEQEIFPGHRVACHLYQS